MNKFDHYGGSQKFGAWGPVPANYAASRMSPYDATYGQQSYGQQSFHPQANGQDPGRMFSQRSPNFNGQSSDITTVWVGDLPTETRDEDLLNGFMLYGNILGATVNRKAAASGVRSGFVRFSTRDEASLALNAAVSGEIVVAGSPVSVSWARSNTTGGSTLQPGYTAAPVAYAAPPRQVAPLGASAPNYSFQGYGASYYSPPAGQSEELATIWVGNLPEGTSDSDLAGTFAHFGQVVGATVSRKASPMGSHSGFVRFSTRYEATQALNMCSSGQVAVYGAALVASWAKTNSKVDPSIAAAVSQYSGADLGLGGNGYEASGAIPQTAGAAFADHATSGSGSMQTLFIGSLPPHASEADVNMALNATGIEGVLTLNRPSARGGSGFLRFDTPQNAQISYQYLCENPMEMEGQQLVFKWAKNDTRSH